MRYINWLTLVKGNWACWQGDWINEMHWLMMMMFLWSNWKLDWKRDVLICCTAWICEISCWRKGGLLTMWIQPKVKHFNYFIADMRAEIEPGNPDLLETQTRQMHTGRGQNKNWMWSMKKGMQILMQNGKIGNWNWKCNVQYQNKSSKNLQFMSSKELLGLLKDLTHSVQPCSWWHHAGHFWSEEGPLNTTPGAEVPTEYRGNTNKNALNSVMKKQNEVVELLVHQQKLFFTTC